MMNNSDYDQNARVTSDLALRVWRKTVFLSLGPCCLTENN